jgi:alkylhydroperoxidase/carboxymuconolactone decarboxylase family protein YurZ
MPWIRTIPPEQASGPLRESYDRAVARAGRVFAIVRAMSLAPEVLDASIGLYRKIMFARDGISRRQREMIAVVVSVTNGCHY